MELREGTLQPTAHSLLSDNDHGSGANGGGVGGKVVQASRPASLRLPCGTVAPRDDPCSLLLRFFF